MRARVLLPGELDDGSLSFPSLSFALARSWDWWRTGLLCHRYAHSLTLSPHPRALSTPAPLDMMPRAFSLWLSLA